MFLPVECTDRMRSEGDQIGCYSKEQEGVLDIKAQNFGETG